MARLEIAFGVQGLGSVTGALREVELGLARTAKAARESVRDWKYLSETLQRTGIALTAVGGALMGTAALMARAAMEEEASIARLSASLQAMGLSWARVGTQTEQYIATMQRLTGFSDGQLRPALARAVQITRDYEGSLAAVSMAANVARATGMDLESATLMVSKALVGNTSALQRQGIALREGASATEVMTELQKRFGGASETYMKTAAGATDRLRNAVADLKEEFGKHLLPVLADIATAMARLIERVQTLDPAMQRAIAWGTVLAGAFAAVVGPTLILVANLPRLAAGFAMVQAAVLPLAAKLAPLAAGLAVVGAAIVGISREAAERQRLLNAAKEGVITHELARRALMGEAAARKVALALISDHEQALRKQGQVQDDLAIKLPTFSVAGVKAIKAVRAAAKELAETLDPGLLATLTWLGKAWEGMASEAQRALGWMGRSTKEAAAEAQRVLATVTRELAEASAAAIAKMRREQILYQQTLDEIKQAEEDRRRLAQFDADRTNEFVEGIRRRIEAEERELELLDDQDAKLRRRQAMLASLIAEITREIEAMRALAEASREAGLPFEHFAGLVKTLEELLARLQHQSALTGKTIAQRMLEPLKQAAETLRQAFSSAFETLFLDVLTRAKTFGEAIMGFFRSIVSAILSMIARALATRIFEQFFFPLLGPLFGALGLFAHGGIVPGRLIPIAAFQHGGLVQRPTLAAVGEGGPEAVIPLRGGRIPVEFVGGRGGDIHIHYSGPITLASGVDIRQHARAVADAVRLARRGNHPMMREHR